jgi:hypothetical protein
MHVYYPLTASQSAWLVLPAPLLTGLSESIAVVSAMELGYTMSPRELTSYGVNLS